MLTTRLSFETMVVIDSEAFATRESMVAIDGNAVTTLDNELASIDQPFATVTFRLAAFGLRMAETDNHGFGFDDNVANI